MKNASTIADAATLTKGDVFDLESAYVEMVASTVRDDRQGVFHPSAVGMCGRRNVYEFIRTPAIQTIEAADLEVFDIGHAVHDLVQTKMEALGPTLASKGIEYRFEREVKYDPATDALYVDFGIGGTADGLLEIWTPEWFQRSVLEVKSIKDKNYHKLTGPKEDHVMQAHLYAYRLDAPIMYIWYYNKDTSARRVFTVIFDHAILMAALNRYQTWLKHVDEGTLPDREESWWGCPRCPYREVCQPPTLKKIKAKEFSKKVSRGRSAGRLHRVRYEE